MNPRRRGLLFSAPLWLAAPRLALGQSGFPNKPIRFVVPVAPGGGADLVARTVAERWSRVLDQTFVVENKGGAGGVIASQMVAQAPPDGYMLLEGYVATHGTNPATRKVPYDPVNDFTAIGMIGGTPNVLVVGPQVPVKTLAEFIVYVRQQDGRLNYGSAGAGSLTHLTMEIFSVHHKLKMNHAAYRGIAPAFTDLIGGQVQAMFPGLAAAMPHIRSGQVRALAVTGAKRHPLLPDVPTLEESGMKGFDAMQWYGVVGPAGMPADIVAILNQSLNKVLRMPDLKERLAAEALDPLPMEPAQFRQFIVDDIARWTRVAQERNIHLDN